MAFAPVCLDFAIIHCKTPRGILPVNSYICRSIHNIVNKFSLGRMVSFVVI